MAGLCGCLPDPWQVPCFLPADWRWLGPVAACLTPAGPPLPRSRSRLPRLSSGGRAVSPQTPVAFCPSSLIYTCVRVQSLSCVRLFVTSWTIACHPLLSMGFSIQEYWSGLPFPPPGDLPNPGMEPVSLGSPALAGRFFTISTIWEARTCVSRGQNT